MQDLCAKICKIYGLKKFFCGQLTWVKAALDGETLVNT